MVSKRLASIQNQKRCKHIHSPFHYISIETQFSNQRKKFYLMLNSSSIKTRTWRIFPSFQARKTTISYTLLIIKFSISPIEQIFISSARAKLLALTRVKYIIYRKTKELSLCNKLKFYGLQHCVAKI